MKTIYKLYDLKFVSCTKKEFDNLLTSEIRDDCAYIINDEGKITIHLNSSENRLKEIIDSVNTKQDKFGESTSSYEFIDHLVKTNNGPGGTYFIGVDANALVFDKPKHNPGGLVGKTGSGLALYINGSKEYGLLFSRNSCDNKEFSTLSYIAPESPYVCYLNNFYINDGTDNYDEQKISSIGDVKDSSLGEVYGDVDSVSTPQDNGLIMVKDELFTGLTLKAKSYGTRKNSVGLKFNKDVIIRGILSPMESNEAANKKYVDDNRLYVTTF